MVEDRYVAQALFPCKVRKAINKIVLGLLELGGRHRMSCVDQIIP